MILDNLILNNPKSEVQSSVKSFNRTANKKKVYIETYGCQMNFSDTEIVLSVLSDSGYNETKDITNSDVILLNTCAIRERAETTIYHRLEHLKEYKKKNRNLVVGILGCMAERLRANLLEKEKIVDLIVGPDEYRKVPELIDNALDTGEKGIAVKLSRIETYDDITPVRREGITAWLSIMRGCDKFCTFCVVPFTRGRERSRKLENIVIELVRLRDAGVKDVSLLGQNVNSYRNEGRDFPDLLEACAKAAPDIRIRFTTSHPYDLSIKLLEVIAKYDNICKYIHLPVQSGSDRVLKKMNRLYSVEHYLYVMRTAREMMPGIGLSTDIITGFPGENEDDHKMTLDLVEQVRYDGAYTFAYSPRENTKAYKMIDTVPDETKQRRLAEVIELQRRISTEIHSTFVGREVNVLVENISKKSKEHYMARTDCNKSVIIPKNFGGREYNTGDFVNVLVNKANSATLVGEPVIS